MSDKSWLVDKPVELDDCPGEFEDIKCNYCGSTERELVIKVKDYETFFSGQFSIVRCSKCGLTYMAPRLTQETLIKYFYPEDYTCYGEQTVGFFEKLRWLVVSKPKVKVISNLVGQKNIRLLDVGCGDGKFLHYLKLNTSWDAIGVDPNPISVKFAEQKGIDVRPTSLEQASFPDEHFDVVTMNQVIEHVPFPYDIMKEVFRILKKEGLFITENPNYRGFECRLFKSYWWGYHGPRHLHFYTYEMITKMLESVGFNILKINPKRRPGGIAWSFQNLLLEKGVDKNIAYRLGLNNPAMALLFAAPEIIISIFERTSMMEVISQKPA